MKKIKMLFPSKWKISDVENWIKRQGELRIKELGLKPANCGDGIVADIKWNEEQ